MGALLGQLGRTRALALVKTGPAVLMRFLDIPFAFLWQVLLLKQPAPLTSVAGAVMIVFSAGYVVWQTKREQQQRQQRSQHEDEGPRADVEIAPSLRGTPAPATLSPERVDGEHAQVAPAQTASPLRDLPSSSPRRDAKVVRL